MNLDPADYAAVFAVLDGEASKARTAARKARAAVDAAAPWSGSVTYAQALVMLHLHEKQYQLAHQTADEYYRAHIAGAA